MKRVIVFIVVVIFLAILATAGFYFFLLPKRNQGDVTSTISDQLFGWKFPTAKFPNAGPTGNQLAYSSIRDPGGIPEGLPVRLKIPIINVDSAIEDAFITPDGRMDVPAGSRNVAWFSPGPHPGNEGSAVIGGHFGISKGAPWVFYNLDKLKIGDKIYIENDKGETLTFQVRTIKSFDRNADATTVFTSDDGLAHLNLITCEGIWNQVNGTYPERLVVFTNLVSSGGATLALNSNANPFPRSLAIGSQGSDVVALQNILEQKGFLVIPAGIAKGLFGGLTRGAVTKYQTSVGLPPVGLFGPLTRAKLTLELSNRLALPNTGPDANLPDVVTISGEEKSLGWPRTFVEPLKSLYATGLDGLITSLLLISIIFVAFNIIRRAD